MQQLVDYTCHGSARMMLLRQGWKSARKKNKIKARQTLER